jgi:hypothetical protein
MLIDEILAKFEGGGSRNYYSFETFILNLLKYHIESQGKELVLVDRPFHFGDAYAANGFDNFVGSTLIEIKANLERRILPNDLEQLAHRASNPGNYLNFVNLLIINFRDIPETNKKKIIARINSLSPDINVEIWGPEEINKIVNKHKKHAATIVNNLFSLRLENTVTKSAGNWKEDRTKRIELLKEVYESGQFALLLGAGISSSAGMPDWNTLLNSLFVSYLTKEFNQQTSIVDADIKQIVDRLNKIDEPSALMAARYLRKGLSREKKNERIYKSNN